MDWANVTCAPIIDTSIRLDQLAKIISDALINVTTETTIKRVLRDTGWLIKDRDGRDIPTPLATDNGLLVFKYDPETNTTYPAVTPIGVNYFINLFNYFTNGGILREHNRLMKQLTEQGKQI